MCQQSFRLVFICCWLNKICERWHRLMGLIIKPQYVPSGRSFLLWLCRWHSWPPGPSFLIKLGKISVAANSVGEFAREQQLGEVIHFSWGAIREVALNSKTSSCSPVGWTPGGMGLTPRLVVNTGLQKWLNRGQPGVQPGLHITWRGPPQPPLALTNTSRGSDRADSSVAGRGPKKLPSP